MNKFSVSIFVIIEAKDPQVDLINMKSEKFFTLRFVITETKALIWGMNELCISCIIEVSHFGIENTLREVEPIIHELYSQTQTAMSWISR